MSRGRKKESLREFTRRMESQEDKEYFRKAMDAPSDLACAVLQSIHVEHLLEESIILRFYRRDDDTINILSKENGSLGTYFSKIGLGYALGIYDADIMEYLNAIRRIRNAFAHARRKITFATAPIRSELHALKLPKTGNSRLNQNIALVKKLTHPDMPQHVSGEGDMENRLALTGRAAYTIVCMELIGVFLRDQGATYRRMTAVRSGSIPEPVAKAE